MLANIQLQKVFTKKCEQLLSHKDELIQTLTGRSEADAEQQQPEQPEEAGHHTLGSTRGQTTPTDATQAESKKQSKKFYSDEEAEQLYWAWFQLKIKQAIHHLYLSTVGNVQSCFYPHEQLMAAEKRKGGYRALACADIFDF